MKPVLTDRMAVVLITAAVVVWVLSLGVLWGWTFDASGTFSLTVWGLGLAAGWWTLRRRVRLVGHARRVLRWCGLHPWEPFEDALAGRLGSSREDAAARMRVLAVSGVVVGACMVLATLWILASAALATLGGQWLLLGGFQWRLVELLCLGVGSVPVGLAVAAVWFGATVVRATGGRDTYAAALRDVLGGVAVGLAGMAVAWWFGANLVYLVFALAGGVVAVGIVAVSRGELSTHPRKQLLPFGPPGRWDRPAIAAGFATLLVVLGLQNRLLADVLGVSLTRRLLWAGLSVALLVFFMARQDRKGRTPGRAQLAGTCIGLAAGLAVQAVELLLCLSLVGGAGVVSALAIATQIPLAAQASIVLCAHRREFATAGGSPPAYASIALFGLLAGAVLLLLAGTVPGGWRLVAAVPAGLMLGGALAGGWHLGRFSRKAQWLVWSAVLAGSLSWGIVHTARIAKAEDVSVYPGVWLTAEGEVHRWRRRFVQFGVLPEPEPRRSQAVTDCLETVLRLRKGRWWIVATSARDLPDPDTVEPTVYNRVVRVGASPQPTRPTGTIKRRWPPLSYSHPNVYRYARASFLAELGSDFYDVVFLAPLPADHPQAWRCYHERLLLRCAKLIETRRYQLLDGREVVTTARGLMVLRTQTAPHRVRRALGVARTFHQAVRSGWAVAAVQRNGLDLLLLGPDNALAEQRSPDGAVALPDLLGPIENIADQRSGVYVVPIETLWEAYSDVRAIRLASPPPARLADTPELQGLRNVLENKHATLELRRQQQPTAGTDTP